MSRPTISITPHTNNFDALRLYAALLVIYGHGFNMAGQTGPGLWGVPFARVGLDVFFSISGYLVTGSYDGSRSLGQFAVKRALRIWPGLAACVVLSAYLLGPLVTTVPLSHYFPAHLTTYYLVNLVFFSSLYLPGVFHAAHYVGVVNGSLWSLFPEVLCYATVPLFALLRGRARQVALLVAGLLAGSTGVFMFEGPNPSVAHLYGAEIRYVLVTVPFFFVAACYRLAEGDADRFYRGDVALLLFMTNWAFSSWFDWWNLPIEWLTLPYIVITFGRQGMPVLRRAARFGDLSYGTYLWAFPIQQLVLTRIPTSQPILLCVALTLPVAFLSWHLVEKPAIQLRRSIASPARPLTGMPRQRTG